MSEITVSLSNSGGVIDKQSVGTPEEAAAQAVQMIKQAGVLHVGDKLEIGEHIDDDDADETL